MNLIATLLLAASVNPSVSYEIGCTTGVSSVNILVTPALEVDVGMTWPGAPAGYVGFTQVRPGTLTLEQMPGVLVIHVGGSSCAGGPLGILRVASPGPFRLAPVDWMTRIVDCTGAVFEWEDVDEGNAVSCHVSSVPVVFDATWETVKGLYR